MLKRCPVCDTEFESDKLSKKYCSEECRLAKVREKDRLRKRKEREEERAIREKEKQRIQQAKNEAREQAEQKNREAREQDLKARVKAGDPLARMQVANPFSVEYWEAYKDYEIENSLKYDAKPIRYVNGISVHDDDFTEKVMLMIEQQGIIYSDLITPNPKEVLG